MHWLHCYAAAQHLPVHHARAGTRAAHSRTSLALTDITAGRGSCERRRMEAGGRAKRRGMGRGVQKKKRKEKKNDRAEGAASMGKLDNERLSLASMMDEG